MEEFIDDHCDNIKNAVRKRRTLTSRRPRPDSCPLFDSSGYSTLSLSPISDDVNKVSSDENIGTDFNSMRKDFNLNQSVSKISSNGAEGSRPCKKIKEDVGSDAFCNNEPGRAEFSNEQSREGVLATANWKCTNARNGEVFISGQSGVTLHGLGHDSKVKKVKLKVGGVTRTINADSNSDGVAGDCSRKGSQALDAARPRKKQNYQGNYLNDYHSPSDKNRLQGILQSALSKGDIKHGKEYSLAEKMAGKDTPAKHEKSEPVRKSKRVPKRWVLGSEFGEDDEDEEIRYLRRLKGAKVIAGQKEGSKELGKKQGLLKVSALEHIGSTSSGKDRKKKKTRSDRGSEDAEYGEEEDPISDKSMNTMRDKNRETTLNTRQQALQSSKDGICAPGSSMIEFPDGLPPAPPRKQKEKLSEVEQQLKKAEAAQRRRMQVEKAARESEAEAIRKILGQDSNRKKREEQKRKRQEELAQEKAINALMVQSNSIRWFMGPSGTTVTFPKDMGLPSIFDSKPCSYPPSRGSCAAPSCNNPYKYRDSKTMLPLCSLQCYKAIREKAG